MAIQLKLEIRMSSTKIVENIRLKTDHFITSNNKEKINFKKKNKRVFILKDKTMIKDFNKGPIKLIMKIMIVQIIMRNQFIVGILSP
jgi:hypothetical protein